MPVTRDLFFHCRHAMTGGGNDRSDQNAAAPAIIALPYSTTPETETKTWTWGLREFSNCRMPTKGLESGFVHIQQCSAFDALCPGKHFFVIRRGTWSFSASRRVGLNDGSFS